MSVKIEDIPYHLQPIVEIIGIEKFLEICKMYGGYTLYIPVYDKVVMPDRNRKIVSEYNGVNLYKLRVKYGISERQVKWVLKKEGVR